MAANVKVQTNPAQLVEQAVRAAMTAELARQCGISLEAVVHDILKHDPDLKAIVQKHLQDAIPKLIRALKRTNIGTDAAARRRAGNRSSSRRSRAAR